MSEYKRLTKKSIGCFEYRLKDHKPVVGEFGTYEAFYDYSMAVRQLGKYEDIGLSPERIKQILDSRPLYRLEKGQVIVDEDAFNHCNELATAYSQIGSLEEFAELAKAKAENRWISITERLPESGKHVLLCCVIRPSGRKYICDGYYAKENTLSCNCDDDIAFIYSEDDDEYYLAEGYYEVIKNWGDYSSVAIGDFVTHWMMLPELPELPEEAEQALKNGGEVWTR